MVDKKKKQLLKYLIESKIIYEWDEAVLYSLLLRRGVLNLDHKNRHSQFFKNLILASRTVQGKNVIEKYAYSNEQNPPNIPGGNGVDEEIQTATSEELNRALKGEDSDVLDRKGRKTPKQILAQTNFLESIYEDVEAMKFYLTYCVNELWKSVFRDTGKTFAEIRREGKTGKKFHDIVLDTFLSEYDVVTSVEEPNGYSFSIERIISFPTLMQKYIAYKVKTLPFFGNFSGTGAGKTLSAILASRIIDSKMSVIVCPNDVVDQWKEQIKKAFPNDSNILTGKEAFYAKYDENKHQYLILNYDKFSQEDSPNLILNLAGEKIDLLILDEIHFVKKRDDQDASNRHKNLAALRSYVRKKNSEVKVLGMSATPVINNLKEGRSLLEMITGKIYHDIATKARIPNAVSLYEKLSTISIRELPEYKSDVKTEFVEVHAEKPLQVSIAELKSSPLLIEQILTDARLPEIINRIKGQTLIYTKYVTEIVDKLKRVIADAGYTFAEYTGSIRELRRFLDKEVQVLIASDPISVGIDGLQLVCNNLIINTLPWTIAQYQQLIGRLHRIGQRNRIVNVHIIKATINGYTYDQYTWNRIEFKRTLADCAVDGWLPQKNLVSQYQMQMEAIRWLERLELDEISSVTRRDLDVELSPIEIEKRFIKYGDFSQLSQHFNTENSFMTHKKIKKDPEILVEYHRQFRELKKGWVIKPVEQLAKKIKELRLPQRLITNLVIGDFGCGEAELMQILNENKVYSFDHHSVLNENIIPCDMKSVKLDHGDLDVAVFSLSLMGRNWTDYITEAKRCLVKNGYLLIAETTRSLKSRLSKLRNLLEEQGFEIYSEEVRNQFTFIEARKL